MEAAARKTMIAKPDIPETMRAAGIARFGGPEVISTHTLPVARPNAQEVLIKLQSAGVGLWDAHMRDGSWVVGKKRFPFILGIDGAGTVAAVGARVKRFAVGDFVYAYSYTNRSGGFYAEYAAVAAGRVAYPNGIEPEPRKRKGLKIKSYDAENEPRHFEQLNAAMTEGRIEVPIAEVFPLGEAGRAHERLARGHILGKIVLDVAR